MTMSRSSPRTREIVVMLPTTAVDRKSWRVIDSPDRDQGQVSLCALFESIEPGPPYANATGETCLPFPLID
jgi:hypothetical protein